MQVMMHLVITHSFLHVLTRTSKSSMYVSFVAPASAYPPNSTAWWLLIMLREKFRHGGGIVPVTAGQNHFPKEYNPTAYICGSHR